MLAGLLLYVWAWLISCNTPSPPWRPSNPMARDAHELARLDALAADGRIIIGRRAGRVIYSTRL